MSATRTGGLRTRSMVASRLRQLPLLLSVTTLVMVLAATAGYVARGPVGALGAAIGVATVALSYTVSSVVIAYTDVVNRPMLLVVGIGTYVIKFTIFGVVMVITAATGWAGIGPLAAGIVAGVLGWVGAQVWWSWHSKIPYVDPDEI